jgi:hypothetical protein
MEENEKKNGLKNLGGETVKKRLLMILPIVAIAVLALAALSTPALADYAFDGSAPTTRTDGAINGTVFVDSVGYNGQTTRTLSTNVPSGTVKAAYLYTGIWCGTNTNIHWVNVTFNGNYTANGLGPINISGIYDNNPNVWCTGYGKSWWWYNVTNLTNAGQTNTATVSKINGSYGNVYGIVLVVVLENNSLSPVQYWINDGSDCLNYVTPHESGTTYFNGNVDNANVTKSALTAVHLTGYSPKCGNALDFNDHPLDTNCVDSNTFEINTWDETNSNVTPENVTSSGNHADYRRCEDGYVNFCNAILVLHNTTAAEPDLVVSDIELPEIMRPGTDFTVKATITNQGSAVGEFNVGLYVNDVLNSTKQHVSSLAAGASTEVSFTNVNLPKGCYEFRVFADCDGDVSESDETNNNMTVNGQVGYVIVVESNGDFDAFVTESENGAFGEGNVTKIGNTYYIRNFTGDYAIENCAGNGITIENTDVTFVITNCTITNCTNSGVKFHNLSDGTIENSTVQDNTRYGIEVGEVPLDSDDPNNVTIRNNLISDTETDVELIAYNSTVINNTIWNNTVVAIYLYGNGSTITYNILKNNVGYAIKAYNSYDNDIYANELICNNIGNPGHQAWDNGTSNHWNTTTIGNYWTDWDDNPGAPGEYSIDGGGGNKDYHPRGLYVFGCNAGTDKWAFRNQTTGCSASDPNTEFTDAQYDKIAEDDDVRQEDQTSTDTYYAAHRFNFSINSSLTSGIDMINATWNGKGYRGAQDDQDEGATLYIYNFTSATCELLQNSGNTYAEVTLTGGVTNATGNIFTDYINAHNVTILVKQNSPHDEEEGASHIATDYIKLVITPECD